MLAIQSKHTALDDRRTNRRMPKNYLRGQPWLEKVISKIPAGLHALSAVSNARDRSGERQLSAHRGAATNMQSLEVRIFTALNCQRHGKTLHDLQLALRFEVDKKQLADALNSLIQSGLVERVGAAYRRAS